MSSLQHEDAWVLRMDTPGHGIAARQLDMKPSA
jgi:hypothetical protein